MAQIVVGMADCRISDAPGQVIATYALGSCIGLIVHDPGVSIGGLLHFMLPDSSIDPGRGRENPYMFADTGIPRLLDQLCALGASKRRMVVQAVGGAHLMDHESVFEIGKRNYLAARRILWKAGVLLHSAVVGGASSRTVWLEIGSGRLWLQEAGTERGPLPSFQQKGANTWPIVS